MFRNYACTKDDCKMFPLRVSKMYTLFRNYACTKDDCKMLPLRVSKMYTIFRNYAESFVLFEDGKNGPHRRHWGPSTGTGWLFTRGKRGGKRGGSGGEAPPFLGEAPFSAPFAPYVLQYL